MTMPPCPSCANPLVGKKCPTCGFSSVPEWLRLWHGDTFSMTFRDEATNVTQQLFHTYFRHVTAVSGHPIAAYFPSDGSPLFLVQRCEDGWFAFSNSVHRNRARLDGTDLDGTAREITDNGRLDIFSQKESVVVGSFHFRFS